MDRSTYEFLTGTKTTGLTDEAFEALISVAESMLKLKLCWDDSSLPLDEDAFALLYASYAQRWLMSRGGALDIQSETVDSESTTYRADVARTAWGWCEQNLGDIIAVYSKCSRGYVISPSITDRRCCG